VANRSNKECVGTRRTNHLLTLLLFLFYVHKVPKSLSEEDIFPTFDAFGPLKDVSIIRDKQTGLHRGCAFVTYWAAADALTAQTSLHDTFTFPGARRATQVKPAEPTSKLIYCTLIIDC
jgi:RNA recognition motif-containing protein